MSTDEYTPDVSTERVRGAATGEQNVPVTPEQFARWLAERDRQVAEQAFDEAVQALAWAMANGPDPMTYVREHNPYRADSAAPDEREALDVEGLPERFRFSRKVYGDVADDATRVLLALTDGGHGDQPSDYLRWVSITAAQALAARPAPAAEDDAVEKAAQAVWERRSRARQIEGRGELKPWHIAVVQAAAWPSSPVAGEVAACRQDARAALGALGLTVADEGRAEDRIEREGGEE